MQKSASIIISAVLNKFRRQCTVIFQIAPFIPPSAISLNHHFGYFKQISAAMYRNLSDCALHSAKHNLKDYGTTSPASRIFWHFPFTDNGKNA